MKKQTDPNIKAHLLRSALYLILLVAVGVGVALSSAINLPNHSAKFPAPQNNTAFAPNGHENASSVAASAIRRDQTLTFSDRVAYQRAIEEVYWQHRIWPKANAGPKPPLDKVMSQAEIEKKVEDYLRNSQVLEDYWQRPITPDQLQAEMERIASHTKQPQVLGEIFAALGNDPFVIAECLARPALAERLVTALYAHDERFHGELKRRAETELAAHWSVSDMRKTSATYSELEWVKSDGQSGIVGQAPRLREDALAGASFPNKQSAGEAPALQQPDEASKAVKLTSSEWNENVEKLAAAFGSAKTGRARPPGAPVGENRSKAPDVWAQIPTDVLSPLQEDDGHYYATAVISKGKDRLKVATIAWMKLPFDSWHAKAETQMPVTMAAVSGNYTLPVISGQSDNWSPSVACSDDTWTATSASPGAREGHTAVWTGSEMIVWSGYKDIPCCTAFNTGGRYNPATDSWTATSTTNAPSARKNHTAVWTGSEMIVWGGQDDTGNANTGGRYNPGTNSWTATTTTGAPDGRFNHTAVWTGSEMIVWGGWNVSTFFNTGGRYNPGTDSWTATTTTSAPTGRYLHTAVWTGSEMIIWGGVSVDYFNTGGRYNPGTNSWTATSTTNAPTGRYLHTAVWTGSKMIVWGGLDPGSSNTGGQYDPATNSWAATSTTNAPEARYYHTAVLSGSQMIVWGGLGCDGGSCVLNSGGRYNPNTDSWTATSTSGAPDARFSHTAVSSGSEMIVWGGSDIFGNVFNTGGRYNPSTDSWIATSAQDDRGDHTAVWTGTEMIVWGGFNSVIGPLNTGGRYNPSTDNWLVTSTTNAPEARYVHTAVWTGSEMIVWGGDSNSGVLNTGGRYNPGTDSWIATSTASAPNARRDHTAVWAGSEMIVWGGLAADGITFLNTGGRYNPGTNAWTATTTTNAPAAREGHAAVWTGSVMIVWGGANSSNDFNTGGRYNPSTNSWTATSLNNAPEARFVPTAVWTRSQMIVWGGDVFEPNHHAVNTGGRYDPNADSWSATTTTGAPDAREGHTAVWTGSQMIVWGGRVPFSIYFNTGGRYNPTTNGWTATSITSAPTARVGHTAVWTGTGSQMIVWGGQDDTGNVNTGGRYCAQGGPTPTPTASPTATFTPTPTATATFTPTPTATFTPTPTPTPCTGRCSPTPRPSPTSVPRPSPATPTPTATGTPSPTPTPIVPPRPRPTPVPRP